MLSFHEITLSDRSLIMQWAQKAEISLSNYGFGHMFMWDHYYRMEMALYEGALFFRYADPAREGGPFMSCPVAIDMPLGDAIALAIDHQRQQGLVERVYSVPEMWLQRIMDENPDRFNYKESPDFADYVYDRQALSELRGKALHSKRNHVNRFVVEYPDFVYRALNGADLDECLDMHSQWWAERDNDEAYAPERGAIQRVVQHMQDLDARGGGIWIGGKLVAMTIATPLTQGSVDVNVEKALSGYNGLYSAINQQFCEKTLGDIQWVNREEDMGLEGLRRAKQSYHPAFMLKKFTFSLKE